MTTEELVQSIRDNFAQRIERKTGWGKNEIITELDKAIAQEAMKALKPFVDSSNAAGEVRRGSAVTSTGLLGGEVDRG